MNAMVFDIEKFAVRDGPGIRTVVFLKGCPLHCLWCHNPESQKFENELFFHETKCTRCGNCVKACRNHCHTIENDIHKFDRTHCTRCMECTAACWTRALIPVAQSRSADDVLAEVLADRDFFGADGGMTLSGGEPMAQFDFTLELCGKAQAAGIRTALGTCGFASEENFRKIAPVTDLFLFDVKGLPEQYEKFTGVGSAEIFQQLELLNTLGKRIFLRCPLIPGINDSPENLKFIASLAEKYAGVEEVDVEPYHPLGLSKWQTLGENAVFKRESFVPDTICEKWLGLLSSLTRKPVRKQ